MIKILGVKIVEPVRRG